MNRRSMLVTLLYFSVNTACDSSPDSPGPQRQPIPIPISNATTHANVVPQWDARTAWRISDHPVLRIGAQTGQAYEEFHSIRGVTRLRSGTIIVLDGATAELRAFDAQGHHLWNAGGLGNGPGEMTNPTFLERLNGDTLQVQDGLARLRFTPSGQLAAHEWFDVNRTGLVGQYFLGEACRGLANFVSHYVIMCRTDTDPITLERPWMTSMTIVRLYWPGVAPDTIGRFFVHGGYAVRGNGALSSRAVPLIAPLGRRGHFTLSGSPPTLLVGYNNRYHIEAYDVASAAQGPPFVRDTARRAWSAVEIQLALKWGPHPPALRHLLVPNDRHFESVDSLSLAIDYLIDELGFVWVRRGPSADAPTTRRIVAPDGSHIGDVPLPSGLYDIFDPDGTFLGTIQLPHRFRIHDIGMDYVLGVVRDSVDVEYVAVHDLYRVR